MVFKINLLDNLPWLYTRKYLITSCLIDFFVIFIICFTKKTTELSSNVSFLGIFFVSVIWILISYIVGRYIYKKQNLLTIIIRNTINSSITFFITYLIIKIFVNVFPSNLNIYIKSFLYIYLITFIANIFINYIYDKFFLGKEYWSIFAYKRDISKIKNSILNNAPLNSIKVNFLEYEEINKINKEKINGIVICNYEKFDYIYSRMQDKKINVRILSLIDFFNNIFQRYPIEIDLVKEILNNKLFISNLSNTYSIQKRLKKILDYVFAFIILILSLPLMVIACITIFIESPKSPIFYSQLRNGKNMKKIKIYKLRTMIYNAEKNGARWSTYKDSRITKVGRILRKTRLDEIPQLLNIFKGEMSLIGPRPERPEIDIMLGEKIPHYFLRYDILPGLSGWAQVNYPYGASVEDAKIKLSYDLYYIYNFSTLLDLLIFIKTFKLVTKASGSEPKNES